MHIAIHICSSMASFFTLAQIFDGKNIDEFDEFPAIRQYFPYQNFHLAS